MTVDLKQTFEIGKKPLLLMGISLLAADILYTAGHPDFSVIILPLFLGLTSYFAHIYSRENTLPGTVVASVLIANSAIVVEAIVLGILLTIAMAAGMYPGLTIELLLASVIDAIVVGVGIFSMISVIVGTVMWVLVRKVL